MPVIKPESQDIFIVAHPKERPETFQGADGSHHQRHPEGAQDLIIAGVDGNIYHVNKKDWKKIEVDLTNNKEESGPVLPEKDQLKITELIEHRSVLAHVLLDEQTNQLRRTVLYSSPGASPEPSSPPAPKPAYYLANFALLNTPERDPEPKQNKGLTPPEPEPKPKLYYVPKAEWEKERLCPGDSVFVLEMLQRGTTIAYIPTTARTMDCVCYLLNLASLNDITVFEPSAKGYSCQKQPTSKTQPKE